MFKKVNIIGTTRGKVDPAIVKKDLTKLKAMLENSLYNPHKDTTTFKSSAIISRNGRYYIDNREISLDGTIVKVDLDYGCNPRYCNLMAYIGKFFTMYFIEVLDSNVGYQVRGPLWSETEGYFGDFGFGLFGDTYQLSL